MKKYKQFILESNNKYTYREWYQTLKNNDFVKAQQMIDDGWDVNATSNASSTALVRCSYYERFDALFFLLKQPNIDVTARDYDGDFMEQLVGVGIDPSTILKNYDLQQTIIKNNRYDIIKMFNDYKAIHPDIRKEYPHLFTGIELGMLENQSTYTDQQKFLLNIMNNKGISAGFDIQPFIDKGVDINIRMKDGDTPLIYAARTEQIHVVMELIKCGADMLLTNDYGQTFLDVIHRTTAKIYLTSYWRQKMILSKAPSLIKTFIDRNIKINEKIRKEFPELFTAIDLNLL